MAAAHALRYSFAEYVALEAYSNVRHEFLDGLILAMAGGTKEHAALAAALTGTLFAQLRGGPCRVYSSDLRVRVVATGLTTYPDVSVVCGKSEIDAQDPNTVLSPVLLVEVTSPSSEDYDRGEKREHYLQIASLRGYLVVSHRERHVEVWQRCEDGTFSKTEARAGEMVRVPGVGAGIELEVNAVYASAAEPAG